MAVIEPLVRTGLGLQSTGYSTVRWRNGEKVKGNHCQMVNTVLVLMVIMAGLYRRRSEMCRNCTMKSQRKPADLFKIRRTRTAGTYFSAQSAHYTQYSFSTVGSDPCPPSTLRRCGQTAGNCLPTVVLVCPSHKLCVCLANHSLVLGQLSPPLCNSQ